MDEGDLVTLHRLGPGDLAALRAGADLFDDPLREGQAQAFLDDPGHEIIMAFAGDRPVGFVSGTVVLHPDKAPSMFVNELGVDEAWRRRGVATRLMAAMLDLARARGCEGAWLGTEPDNGPALGLYRSLGAVEMPFVGFGWDGAFDAETSG